MEDPIKGILLKTQPKHAKTFIENWNKTKKPQVFCIYDRRPVLQEGDTIFVHINQINRLGFVAKFVRSEWVRGFKKTEDSETRVRERERIWNLFSNNQLHTNDKKEFNDFWEQQDGVRSFVVMTDLKEIKPHIKWGEIRNILYTNYPRGIGFLYLTKSEVDKLFQLIEK